MLDVRKPRLRPYALEGNFGLERESLRVTAEGRMALTPHPFPPDHPRIVRDFCENQTEINTGVHPTAEEAVVELKEIDATIRAAIAQQGERLWTNSNPPPISDESEIVPARFEGARVGKLTYRNYLAAKYGKRLMAYCGIHFNFSFGERLVAAAGVDRDALYLHVAAQCVKWGWAIVALTAASPAGQYASVRRSRPPPGSTSTGRRSESCWSGWTSSSPPPQGGPRHFSASSRIRRRRSIHPKGAMPAWRRAMCELLGFSSRKRRRRNDLLREFYSHAEAHPHGWGLARFLDGGAPSIEKEPVCATCSTSLERLLADPVEERTLIAHIRLATVGNIEYKNCHPFTAADNSGLVYMNFARL